MAKKFVILNADDFGLSAGVNEGIIRAHEEGILTSASLMVRFPEARAAAAYARGHPELSVGLHIDLGEWTCVHEQWKLIYQVVPSEDPTAVADEVARQISRFRELIGRSPTHLDSHQHVHRAEPLNSILRKQAQDLGIVLRDCSNRVQYCGDFYGQSNKGYACPDSISPESLVKIFRGISEPSITEIGCHPASKMDMQGMYRQERLLELETLCHPLVRATAIEEQISLCSFAELAPR
jgi:predicted glycoside hydrolase/deacetylase ChbG (UPF0249 family)